MARPGITIAAPKANPKPPPEKKEPTGLPKPKAQVKSEDPAMEAAKRAVQEFETRRRVLQEMREDWKKNYPEADVALQAILQQEDSVIEAMSAAKPLVAAAKQTIGDFIATRKYSNPHYDSEQVTKILATLENRLEVFDEMLSAGIIDEVMLSKEAAIAWFAQHPAYAEVFGPAFKPRTEQTTAVTLPKL